MRERAHSPQSWCVSADADVYLGDDERKIIAWCAEPDSIRNAHLIAAAPDMLTILQEIRCTFDRNLQRPISNDLAEKVSAAIDKAVGVNWAPNFKSRQRACGKIDA